MAEDPIPKDVRRFIGRYINSVEQIELLRLLRRDREHVWTPSAASDVLRTSPGSAELRLDDLARRGIVERKGQGYTYGTRNPHDRIVERVENCYATFRPRVVSLIFAQPG